MKKTRQQLFFLFAILCLSGCCLPLFPYSKTGEPIREDKVTIIESGKTTKEELFEWFGAPTSIAARGEITVIPSVRVQHGGWIGDYYKIETNTFFELFSANHELSEYHRVYYYRYVVSKEMLFMGIVVGYWSGKTLTDSLWALVNEKTGIVEDYVFRKQN